MTASDTQTADVAGAVMKAAPAPDSAASALIASARVAPAVFENPATGTVLTVGQGLEFASLSAALNAAVNGDTILVKAGTYVDDFCTVNTSVTILAMGGVVNEVANEPPPNDKGLITVNANLKIQGFTFTGGSDGSPDGNVAGIRYQAGNMLVSYCYFHGMQEGLLATPNVAGTGTITITHSEFADNGTGDGETHDIYIGAVADFTLSDSYVHDAIVGHEVKSRAQVTTITGNVIADGPTGTSSYEIDIPNGGVAVISGNVMEKGPDASNNAVIHYGGETQYAWAANSLSITGNTIEDDLPGKNAIAVLNQSQVNGLSVSAVFTGNSVYGIAHGNLISGPGIASKTHVLSTDPGYSTVSPWIDPPAVTLGTGTDVLHLTTGNNSVQGGSVLFEVTDTAGNNTISGGSFGLVATVTGGWDMLSTEAGAADTLTLGNRNNVVVSAGHDTIIDNGTYDVIDATGPAKITANSFADYNLAGEETITVNGSGTLNVLDTGTVTAIVGASGLSGSLAEGGAVKFGAVASGGVKDTIGGASAGFTASLGGTLTAALQAGNAVATVGGGTAEITGGAGNDSFMIDAGNADIVLGDGTDMFTFAGGAARVSGGLGADTYVIDAGLGRADTLTITGFKLGIDTLSFSGFSGTAVKSATIAGGSTTLSLTGGATVDIAGVSLPAYAQEGGSPTRSGGMILTGSGQTITGGASLLTVTDGVGGNTIEGGAGGLEAWYVIGDLVSTTADAGNSVTLAGHDTFLGGGGDAVTVISPYNLIEESAAGSITLDASGNLVQGSGIGLASVLDTAGGNAMDGGAGGLDLTGDASFDTVSTLAGATDSIIAGGYSTLDLAGSDTVVLSGNYSNVTANGTALIQQDGGYSSFALNGNDTVQGTGSGTFTIGGQAAATLDFTGTGGADIAMAGGASLALSQMMQDGSVAGLTISGGAATLSASFGPYPGLNVTTAGGGDSITVGQGPASINSAGADTIWAGAGSLSVTASGALHLTGGSGTAMITAGAAGVSVQGGAGNITLVGGSGNDSFSGGSGTADLALGGGADNVTFGTGAARVQAGGADIFNVVAGNAGNDTISGWSGGDQFNFQGFSGSAIAGQTVMGGNTTLSLTDGGLITLMNVTQGI